MADIIEFPRVFMTPLEERRRQLNYRHEKIMVANKMITINPCLYNTDEALTAWQELYKLRMDFIKQVADELKDISKGLSNVIQLSRI